MNERFVVPVAPTLAGTLESLGEPLKSRASGPTAGLVEVQLPIITAPGMMRCAASAEGHTPGEMATECESGL